MLDYVKHAIEFFNRGERNFYISYFVSVSFQQSSIHAIRSFSASFPSRSNLATVTSNKSNQIGDREKRAPFETVEIRDAKRRHLITKRTTGPNR